MKKNNLIKLIIFDSDCTIVEKGCYQILWTRNTYRKKIPVLGMVKITTVK